MSDYVGGNPSEMHGPARDEECELFMDPSEKLLDRIVEGISMAVAKLINHKTGEPTDFVVLHVDFADNGGFTMTIPREMLHHMAMGLLVAKGLHEAVDEEAERN